MNTQTRFLFKELDMRGKYLSMSEAGQAMNENRGYSSQFSQLFGELSALVIMLTRGMKHKRKPVLAYTVVNVVKPNLVFVITAHACQ
jgi:redox-regulated HSP33 family molecular chaperone